MRLPIPREHGAYAQLAAPMLVALTMRVPTVGAALLAVASAAAFVAHEPVLILAGRRGKRAREQQSARARRWLVACGAIAAVGGALGLALAPRALPAAGLAAAVAAIVVLVAWRGHEKTVPGEIVAASALAAAAAPVAMAAGAPARETALVWTAWAVGFAATVIAVHLVIDTHRRRATTAGVLASFVGLAILAAAIGGGRLWIATPLWLVATATAILRPPATRLRTIGVIMAVAATVAAAMPTAARMLP